MTNFHFLRLIIFGLYLNLILLPNSMGKQRNRHHGVSKLRTMLLLFSDCSFKGIQAIYIDFLLGRIFNIYTLKLWPFSKYGRHLHMRLSERNPNIYLNSRHFYEFSYLTWWKVTCYMHFSFIFASWRNRQWTQGWWSRYAQRSHSSLYHSFRRITFHCFLSLNSSYSAAPCPM